MTASDTAALGNWFSIACARLEANGFHLKHDVQFEGSTFLAVARKSGFALTKLGYFERLFVFREFETLSKDSLESFCRSAFRCAKRHRVNPLPVGIFESLVCYPVAVAGSVTVDALAFLREKAPKKHWSAGEIPVVWDRATDSLRYFEKTPVWGAAYYRGFREEIESVIGTGLFV